MPHADIRLVAIDLDGTLLNDAKQVSEQTALALSSLPNKGVKVILASARPPRSVRHVYELLKLDTLSIHYNGALIWHEAAKQVFDHLPLPASLARDIISTARAHAPDIRVSCEILDRWYTDRADDPDYTTETAKLFPDVTCPIDDILKHDITKLMLLGPPALTVPTASMLYARFADVAQFVDSNEPHLIQIMHKDAGKAQALLKVATHYKISPAHILAIGDAPNDLGMLKLAAHSVAMDNAHPLVKQIAHWTAPSNNNHGVHATLLRYGLVTR